MLATFLIWLSVAVAALKLADLLLSDAQKTRLSDVVTKAWDVLDEAKSWSFTDWLKNPRATWWLAISLGLFWASFPIFMRVLAAEDVLSLSVAAGIAVVVVLLSRPIFARLLNFSWGTLVIILFGAWTAAVLITWASFLLEDEPGSFFHIRGVLDLIIFPISIVALGVLAIFLSIAVAYIASAILYVGEFVVRRIAEYPKGPIVALSVLLGSIAALIKVFG